MHIPDKLSLKPRYLFLYLFMQFFLIFPFNIDLSPLILDLSHSLFQDIYLYNLFIWINFVQQANADSTDVRLSLTIDRDNSFNIMSQMVLATHS